ncbi:hypothetical protein BJV77DRAFT_966445 [Russula vinacea]|nr:hypothetical protein BJV77DRAFT_966445 [Russula vinacea]
MLASNIDTLLILASTLLEHNLTPLFANHSDLYGAIDSTPLGDVPWQRSSLRYAREVPDGDVPQWMSLEYEFWFRDPRLIVQNMIFDDSGSANTRILCLEIGLGRKHKSPWDAWGYARPNHSWK